MKKLLMLTAAAGIVFALAEPTLAAQRAHRGVDAYASGDADRSGAYNYGPVNGRGAFGSPGLTPFQQNYSSTPYHGQNLPYPDRPYGAPDSW